MRPTEYYVYEDLYGEAAADIVFDFIDDYAKWLDFMQQSWWTRLKKVIRSDKGINQRLKYSTRHGMCNAFARYRDRIDLTPDCEMYFAVVHLFREVLEDHSEHKSELFPFNEKPSDYAVESDKGQCHKNKHRIAFCNKLRDTFGRA